MANIGNAELPAICSVPPTELEGYMGVARDLLPSVEFLSRQQNIPPRGCALLAGQVLECALKAFLSSRGKTAEISKRTNRHDLLALWLLCCQEGGLEIPIDPPDWVRILAFGHGPNFYLRYQQGHQRTVVNGGSTPNLKAMSEGLKTVVEAVSRAI